MDVKALLAQVNLVAVFERELGQPIHTGRWLTYRCPCHEDRHPSLAITPDRKRWICFGQCNTQGDAIDWMRVRHRFDFGEACSELRKVAGIAPTLTKARQQILVTASDDEPPKWQVAARKLVSACQECLHGNEPGKQVREALHARCLTDKTLIYWRIGYNPVPRVINGLWLPRGVIIPWIEQGYIWTIKIRLTNDRHQLKPDAPKYAQVAGSRSALFGAHTLANRMNSIAMVTEGEFDTMLLHQQAGDVISTVTAGGASSRIDWRWLSLFAEARSILAAHDIDPAGEKASEWWSALSTRVRRVRLPVGKDITEFAESGGDIRAWIQFQSYLRS